MADMANNLTGFIVLVATLGIAAQWLAWRFRLPAILLLSIAGLVVGPRLGWINPGKQLGAMLEPLVGLLGTSGFVYSSWGAQLRPATFVTVHTAKGIWPSLQLVYEAHTENTCCNRSTDFGRTRAFRVLDCAGNRRSRPAT